MTTSSLIFGYGSLLSVESLCATVPGVKNLRPVYISGFRRDFSLWDPEGYTQTNLDIAGIPFCAVDVHKIKDAAARVNGVVFEVDASELPALLEREKEYELVKTTAYDFHTNKPLQNCLVFSANKYNGEYDFDSPSQARYLETCLQGAKDYGMKFYNEFIATTYVGDKLLRDTLELL